MEIVSYVLLFIVLISITVSVVYGNSTIVIYSVLFSGIILSSYLLRENNTERFSIDHVRDKVLEFSKKSVS